MKLIPYPNQVTGHDCLLTTEDNATICKVRNANELDFYLNMDESLRPFTPQFRGTVDVTVSGDDNGKYIFEAHFDDRSSALANRGSKRRKKICGDQGRAKTSKVKYRNLDAKNLLDDHGFQTNAYTQDSKYDISPLPCRVGQNPWVQRVHRIGRHVQAIDKDNTIPYIVLENICRKFEQPCIMDLKLGTRSDTRGCTQEKLQIQLAKNNLTTSCSLGMRLAGLQVYQDGAFTCRNKFYGRGLSQEGLRNNIKLFFSGGGRVQKKIVENVMKQVSQLKNILSQLNGYRFFGSSVVVFYEGAERQRYDKLLQKEADVRIVDFAHLSNSTNDTCGPDEGTIFGLTNFLLIMKELKST